MDNDPAEQRPAEKTPAGFFLPTSTRNLEAPAGMPRGSRRDEGPGSTHRGIPWLQSPGIRGGGGSTNRPRPIERRFQPGEARCHGPEDSSQSGPLSERVSRARQLRGAVTSKSPAQLLDPEKIDRALSRIAHEIVEKNKTPEGLALVGIRTRG